MRDVSEPTFELIVGDGDKEIAIRLSWGINERDASCWRRPLTLQIMPKALIYKDYGEVSEGDRWENLICLSREDMRLLRDWLTTLLASPDLRQDESGQQAPKLCGPSAGSA